MSTGRLPGMFTFSIKMLFFTHNNILYLLEGLTFKVETTLCCFQTVENSVFSRPIAFNKKGHLCT